MNITSNTLTSAICAGIAFVALAAPSWAAYPEFSCTKPNGGQRGSDVALTLTGNRLDDFFRVSGFQISRGSVLPSDIQWP